MPKLDFDDMRNVQTAEVRTPLRQVVETAEQLKIQTVPVNLLRDLLDPAADGDALKMFRRHGLLRRD